MKSTSTNVDLYSNVYACPLSVSISLCTEPVANIGSTLSTQLSILKIIINYNKKKRQLYAKKENNNFSTSFQNLKMTRIRSDPLLVTYAG